MSGVNRGKQCATGIPLTYPQTGNSNDNIQLCSVNTCGGESTIFYNTLVQVHNTAGWIDKKNNHNDKQASLISADKRQR
jgi:hypothetical protein